MSDKGPDAHKLEAFQKLVSDPKAMESLLSQVTPEQLQSALSLFNNLDTKSRKTIGSIISNLGKTAAPKSEE